MKHRCFLVLLIAFGVLNSGIAQDGSSDFPEILYMYQSDGAVSEYRELPELFLVTEGSEYRGPDDIPRVDTLRIKRKLDDNHFVIARSGMDHVGVMSRKMVVKDSVFTIVPLHEGKTTEEVVAKYKSETVPVWTSLLSRQLFSKAMLEKMKKSPGLNEISRDDLLASLDWRKDISDELKAYAEANPDRPYHLRRMVENYRNQKLVLLGYNPYKQVEYNWGKQFEGDEEVIKALTEPISFD